MDANSPLDRAGAPLRCPVNTDGIAFFRDVQRALSTVILGVRTATVPL